MNVVQVNGDVLVYSIKHSICWVRNNQKQVTDGSEEIHVGSDLPTLPACKDEAIKRGFNPIGYVLDDGIFIRY